MSQAVLDLIKENDVKFVDLRFTDSKGKEQTRFHFPITKLMKISSKKVKCSTVLQLPAGKALTNQT